MGRVGGDKEEGSSTEDVAGGDGSSAPSQAETVGRGDIWSKGHTVEHDGIGSGEVNGVVNGVVDGGVDGVINCAGMFSASETRRARDGAESSRGVVRTEGDCSALAAIDAGVVDSAKSGTMKALPIMPGSVT